MRSFFANIKIKQAKLIQTDFGTDISIIVEADPTMYLTDDEFEERVGLLKKGFDKLSSKEEKRLNFLSQKPYPKRNPSERAAFENLFHVNMKFNPLKHQKYLEASGTETVLKSQPIHLMEIGDPKAYVGGVYKEACYKLT